MQKNTKKDLKIKPEEEQPEQVVVMQINKDGDKEEVKYYWSPTKYPPLQIKTNNVTRNLKVEVCSTENEDKQLLHKLLSKTRDFS